uniref:EF-hand domain-containing protein n=1 Tax=Chromera velia CCMP2878 TaxID=1169474 RepID=A0A0G4GVY0_9ALVE|eukprot:Cvel_23622.t1-p1 / transcript=Cvel_23622.t1 / gene=Cvel_23622 / organism=Chromera_velia_CCMP2878 / gene_product=hypothetical protein / transcript_product=hypothetical protein / location=Cvel_scaffold2454:18557-24579(+) / protein_length=774 / sequence_SO=supercontig / SO=protein_coding / is_pseudo=false
MLLTACAISAVALLRGAAALGHSKYQKALEQSDLEYAFGNFDKGQCASELSELDLKMSDDELKHEAYMKCADLVNPSGYHVCSFAADRVLWYAEEKKKGVLPEELLTPEKFCQHIDNTFSCAKMAYKVLKSDFLGDSAFGLCFRERKDAKFCNTFHNVIKETADSDDIDFLSACLKAHEPVVAGLKAPEAAPAEKPFGVEEPKPKPKEAGGFGSGGASGGPPPPKPKEEKPKEPEPPKGPIIIRPKHGEPPEGPPMSGSVAGNLEGSNFDKTPANVPDNEAARIARQMMAGKFAKNSHEAHIGIDADDDGFVDKKEFLEGARGLGYDTAGLGDVFESVDVDSDGKLSKGEWKKAVEIWKKKDASKKESGEWSIFGAGEGEEGEKSGGTGTKKEKEAPPPPPPNGEANGKKYAEKYGKQAGHEAGASTGSEIGKKMGGDVGGPAGEKGAYDAIKAAEPSDVDTEAEAKKVAEDAAKTHGAAAAHGALGSDEPPSGAIVSKLGTHPETVPAAALPASGASANSVSSTKEKEKGKKALPGQTAPSYSKVDALGDSWVHYLNARPDPLALSKKQQAADQQHQAEARKKASPVHTVTDRDAVMHIPIPVSAPASFHASTPAEVQIHHEDPPASQPDTPSSDVSSPLPGFQWDSLMNKLSGTTNQDAEAAAAATPQTPVFTKPSSRSSVAMPFLSVTPSETGTRFVGEAHPGPLPSQTAGAPSADDAAIASLDAYLSRHAAKPGAAAALPQTGSRTEVRQGTRSAPPATSGMSKFLASKI